MQELKQHPLSAAFPSMPEDDVVALSEDIAKHGQREEGVLYEGMVLDGWHRYRACYLVGVEFEAAEFDGKDPVSFVLSKNLHRRHLTASQRGACIVAATNWRPHGDQKSRSAAAADRTTQEMAKEAEVSPRTIENAKAAHKAGLGDEVREGKVSAERAAAVSKLPAARREKAVKAIKNGTPAPKSRKNTPDAEIEKWRKIIEELTEQKSDLADTARELEDKLTVFETTDLDDQQKVIADLQKKLQRKDAEVSRLNIKISDLNNKCNELIRQVKLEKKKNAR